MRYLLLYVVMLVLTACTPVAPKSFTLQDIDALGKNYSCSIDDVESFCSVKNSKLICSIELLDFECFED